jgi:hypothetical protein
MLDILVTEDVFHIPIFPKFIVGIVELINAFDKLVFGNILGASEAEIFPVKLANIPVVAVGATVLLDKGIPPNWIISKLGIAENFAVPNSCVAQFIPSLFVDGVVSEKLVHV